MKKIFGFLFSFPLMGLVLFIFAVSIGVATFIESSMGTSTARAMIYNSWWFELLLFLGIINITGIIIKQKLYKKEKLTLFVFHLAFVVILLGSAITRFLGFEGTMHIRKNETSNSIISEAQYFYAAAKYNEKQDESSKKILFSARSKNYHKLSLNAGDKKLTIECTEIIPNAMEVAKEVENGVPVLNIVVAGMHGRQSVILLEGKSKDLGMFTISFNDSLNTDGLNILLNDTGMYFKSVFEATTTNMANGTHDTLPVNVLNEFKMKTLYTVNGVQFIVNTYYPSAEVDVLTVPHEQKMALPNALKLKVTVGAKTKNLVYFAEKDALNEPLTLKMEGVDISIGYGSRTVKIPFTLKLDEFIVEHYPGSMSPSWFESKITLSDSVKGIQEQQRIFMNNVMKYQGYRFYQSSYDTDELGTLLSVNHDFWGTWVTYLGYLLMSLGMALSLFNKNSRFIKLSSQLKEFGIKKQALRTTTLLLLLTFLIPANSFSQENIPDSLIIPKAQSDLFGKILIQDPGGRIKPVNSLSSELLRKISRKTTLNGLNSDQVLLSMITFPEYWQKVPMIKASHPEILKLLNTEEKLISFQSLFAPEQENHYLLGKYVGEAYAKNPAERSKFDNEVIRLDERANLCYIIYTGEILRIFPKPADDKKTWYHPNNAAEHFKGDDSTFVASALSLYIDALREGLSSKKWENAEMIAGSFIIFQEKFGKDVLPSAAKVNAEILYNKLGIFEKLANIYLLVGFILLIFQFISVFKPTFKYKLVFNISFAIILISFALHAFGLGLRWFISGHAPWSNGYESMIYIGFATILAGILFSRKSGIALSATAILTWIILHVAHLSWMDPEITNLVPVLKSYWLVIHVAVITASYGFLALGALMAFLNLVFMFSQNEKNYQYTSLTIAELTSVIEMTLIAGLYLLTIGTFLGGVWANESWGRYWGWDAKETWALVTVLVYALVSHLRMIPGLKGYLIFNIAALISFSTVIMTYFGVNYYLAGLHSYAKGDSVPVPTFVYYTVTIIAIVIFLAIVNQKMVLKGKKTID